MFEAQVSSMNEAGRIKRSLALNPILLALYGVRAFLFAGVRRLFCA